MIQYELLNDTTHAIDKASIEKGLEAAYKKLSLSGDRHIIIEIVSPAESKRLNRELRGKDEPTDIISISSMETRIGEQVITQDPKGKLHFDLKKEDYVMHDWPVIGQLAICYDAVVENAKRAGQPETRELEWVIEHGVYHVMGYHHTEE